MDSISTFMDFLTKHLTVTPRQLKVVPQVSDIGFLPHKDSIVSRVFGTYNFSFILCGEGFYTFKGKRFPVAAPCVITQWPGEPMFYGPDKEWSEVYIIYPESAGAWLTEQHLFVENRFKWDIRHGDRVADNAQQLYEILTGSESAGWADRVDMLVQTMIMESLFDQELPLTGRHEEAIREIARRMRAEPQKFYDHAQIADNLGISISGFRNYFLLYMKVPPGEYLLKCRINASCRMLAETRMPIGETAVKCGFRDQLYFSRRFRQETGMTPSDYRRLHRMVF